MAKRRKVNNLLALALLALLVPGHPMHPYEMANMLRRTNKDQDMKIKWGSLYTVVANLEKHGFIEATGSSREGRRPERTVYAITAAGRAELTDWLHELVSVPEPQYPPFKAALSVLGVLSPDDAIAQLQQRLHTLDESIAKHRTELAESGKEVARIFLIEEEYELAMREAEARWIGGLLQEVADGTLPGVAEWRTYHETGGPIPEWEAMLDEGGPPPD